MFNTETTILIVDDDRMNLEILEVILSALGHTILKACNGAEAVSMLEQNKQIDVILLDLEMPVMNGYEVITRLKEHFIWREIPIIVVTAGSNEVTKTLALGANDFVTKPYNQEELKLRIMNHIRTKKLSDMAKEMNNILEQEVVKKTADLRAALAHSKEAEFEISIRLGKAAEFRDQETGMHTRRISELSFYLGELAQFDADSCEILRKSSPLHDVGKIGIPDAILLKPGKLDHDEFEIMKQHTRIGAEILADSGTYPLLNVGAVIAMQHHEKWDGSGYPHGLKGLEINRFARVVTIVDIFDALLSERPYKKPFSIEKTVSIMEEGGGEFFDSELLSLLLNNIPEFIAIRNRLQDTVQGITQ